MVFFMSPIVDMSAETMPSENVSIMDAKIACRVHKLDLFDEPSWFASVQRTLERTSRAVHGKWQQVMARNNREIDVVSLEKLNVDQDIHCALLDLDRYLYRIGQRGDGPSPAAEYQPQLRLLKFQAMELPPCLNFGDTEYKTYNLAAFERWVSLNLDAWLDCHQNEEGTCSRLSKLMTRYHGTASSLYSHNPEALSVMLLTLLELWIACDKSAIHIHKALEDYDACIPIGVFQSLLLPFQSQMIRLARAEEYMQQSQQSRKYPGPGIFRDFGTASCFSVRYFDSSIGHQRLCRKIEGHANDERMQKKSELRERHRKHGDLKNLSSQTPCEYYEALVDHRYQFRETRHSGSCARCRYESEANSIKIDIHEWPLPTSSLQAKSTVFELLLPQPFGYWRDTTIFFLCDVLDVQYASSERPRCEYRPDIYQGLSSFFTRTQPGQRIGPLSQIKPNDGTHRRKKLIIDVTENDICLNNGLHFQYHDNSATCFVNRLEQTLKTEHSCTYRLPKSRSSLQRFLFRPAEEPCGPSPNTVIAIPFRGSGGHTIG